MTPETWRPIPGFPDYEVSDTGKVKSFKRGVLWGRKLKLSPDSWGYLRATLLINGRSYIKGVHQLVMLAFVGPCPEGMEICHNDGNPINNHLGNLRYDTHKANIQDAVRHGRMVGRPRKVQPTKEQAL